MNLTDKIIQIYFGCLIAFVITFHLVIIISGRFDQERAVQCTVGNHPVSSLRAWNMDTSLTGKYHWVCDKHLVIIYPRTVGK